MTTFVTIFSQLNIFHKKFSIGNLWKKKKTELLSTGLSHENIPWVPCYRNFIGMDDGSSTDAVVGSFVRFGWTKSWSSHGFALFLSLDLVGQNQLLQRIFIWICSMNVTISSNQSKLSFKYSGGIIRRNIFFHRFPSMMVMEFSVWQCTIKFPCKLAPVWHFRRTSLESLQHHFLT